MRSYLTLLGQRTQFRLLWLAQVVSLTGDWFNTIAAVILVNRYTDSGQAVSLLFLARGLPPFLFGPLAGVVADRFNRRTVIFVSDVLRGVIVLGFLLVNSADRVWLLYLLTTLQFMVSAFFEPARAAILPSVVERDELLTANTLSSATWSAMLAVGAAVGGLTAAIFGVQVALIIDASTFFVSAFFIAQIRGDYLPHRTDNAGSGWMDMVDGFKYVTQRPRTGVFTLVKGMAQVGSVDIMFALFAKEVFAIGKDSAITLGVLYACFGIGSIIGPVLGDMLSDGSQRFLRRWIWLAFALLAIGWLGFGLAPFFGLAAIAIVFRGMGSSINWTYSSVVLQLRVPDQFLGRVFALDFSLFTLGYATSVWLTGSLLDILALNPRQLAIGLAVGGLVPLIFWTFVNRDQEAHEHRAETVS